MLCVKKLLVSLKMHTDVDVEVLIIGVKRLLSENSDSPLSNICKKFKNYKQEVSFSILVITYILSVKNIKILFVLTCCTLFLGLVKGKCEYTYK